MVQNGHRENTGKYGDASPEIRGRFPYFPDSRHTEHGGILPRHTGPATENGGPSRLTIAVRKKRKTKELTRRRGDAEKAKKEETTKFGGHKKFGGHNTNYALRGLHRKVLVDLEPHQTTPGNWTTRSFASSAAYEMAAWMSSAASVG